MNAPNLRLLALSAAFALVACGGGGGNAGGAGGSVATPPPPSGAPAPGPSPSPAPAPAPTPSPGPAPAPSPAPAPPSEAAQRGAALYQRNCASCHGSEPENGTQGINKGTTPAVLQAAYRRVDVMNLFNGALSARDTEDLAAFIAYRTGLN